jgi:hypothetical protein
MLLPESIALQAKKETIRGEMPPLRAWALPIFRRSKRGASSHAQFAVAPSHEVLALIF